MGDLFQPAHLFVIAMITGFPAIVILVPFWFICKKAGFSPFLTFVNLIPFGLGTLALVYLLAFADWKVTTFREVYARTPASQPPVA